MKKAQMKQSFQTPVLICGASELWALCSNAAFHVPKHRAWSLPWHPQFFCCQLHQHLGSGIPEPRMISEKYSEGFKGPLVRISKDFLISVQAEMGKIYQLIWQSQLLFSNSLETEDCGTPQVPTSKVDLCRSWQTSLPRNLYLCSWPYNSKVVAK